jgi:hypothetical protein
MEDRISNDPSDDGVDRRGFLKCMAWAVTGMVWAVSGGKENKFCGNNCPDQPVQMLDHNGIDSARFR